MQNSQPVITKTSSPDGDCAWSTGASPCLKSGARCHHHPSKNCLPFPGLRFPVQTVLAAGAGHGEARATIFAFPSTRMTSINPRNVPINPRNVPRTAFVGSTTTLPTTAAFAAFWRIWCRFRPLHRGVPLPFDRRFACRRLLCLSPPQGGVLPQSQFLGNLWIFSDAEEGNCV